MYEIEPALRDRLLNVVAEAADDFVFVAVPTQHAGAIRVHERGCKPAHNIGERLNSGMTQDRARGFSERFAFLRAPQFALVCVRVRKRDLEVRTERTEERRALLRRPIQTAFG